MAETNGAPVSPGERSHLLDGLRGVALLGILLANLMVFCGFGLMSQEQRALALYPQFNDLIELLIEWLVVGKFYSIFSLLFGIGFAIQIGRLARRGEGVGRYLRRLVILFLIGLTHMLLLWLGDIVALYALMGVVLLLFRNAADRTLLVWAVLLWLAPVAWAAMIHFAGIDPSAPLFGMAFQAMAAQGIDLSRGPVEYYRTSGYLVQLAAHPAEMLIRIADLLYQLRPAKVLAMFLVGLWVGRRAIYSDPAAHRPLLRRVATIGLGVGLPLSFARAALDMAGPDTPLVHFAVELLYCAFTPTLALSYAAGLALLWANGRRALLELATPAGRMALTNYLMQTVLQSLLFYGWGLGLMGSLGLIFVPPLAAAIFAFQLAYSRWWLARFRFGPVEWLWRSLTYGKMQPMRVG